MTYTASNSRPEPAQDPMGQPESAWWTAQWLDLINSYRFKKRLERGWRYAREGNVLNIWFEQQTVKATVQGTDPEPYELSIWLDALSDEDWDFVLTTLSQRSVFAAKLLAGEMPHNIEDVFAVNGLRLFPFNLSEVRSRCSCPDKANPCKHISAVYYLLGDRFSEDPFVLFQLRGRTRQQLLTALRQKRYEQGNPTSTATVTQPVVNQDLTSQRLLQSFWAYDAPLDPSLVVIAPPASNETLLDSLGSIPFSVPATKSDMPTKSTAEGETSISSNAVAGNVVTNWLEQTYQTISQQAMLKGMVQGNEP